MILNVVCIGILFSVLFVSPAWTQEENLSQENAPLTDEEPGQHAYSLGLEGFYYSYTEPFVMRSQGPAVGLNGRYHYKSHNNLTRALEGRLAYGRTNYTSYRTGKVKGEPNIFVEVRALIGRELPLAAPEATWEPYTGFGYRYKADNTDGMTSSTGHWGYDRQSHYFYLPIGAEMKKVISDTQSFSVRGEFDLLLLGIMHSHSDLYTFSRTFTQKRGYGLKGEAMMHFKMPKGTLSVGPFAYWWEIADSSVDKGYVEPHNHTVEAGLKLTYTF